jgi:site-specific recombinase XerD
MGKPVRDFTLDDLALVKSEDIEDYMEYLSYYIRPAEEGEGEGSVMQNEARGKSRKLAAVRTMFRFFYKKHKLDANPAELVDFPKLHDKTITVLEVDEIAKLLDEVDSGEHLTDRQKLFHEQTKVRDAAIITLLLGTGMRVSECVGLDLNHIDFNVNGLVVTRKGGDDMILYFGDEVEAALKRYIALREQMTPIAGHERALFLSLKDRRITDRAVQNLVKKYASLITHLKNISPHKLRSTFGTQLYRETGDIYLVANVLGHADVNTTRRHYAKADDDQRRRAANAVRLRE